jgi:hypothetical protein
MSRWVPAARRRTVIASVFALVLALLAAVPASADADKFFSADATTQIIAGSTDTSFSVSITNDTSPQTLGSANIAVPAGLEPFGPIDVSGATPEASVTLVGRVLQLRDLTLPPGDTATVTLTIIADCGQLAPYTWDDIAVKQANDFNGTGNDFVLSGASPVTDLTGACQLEFLHQPANAEDNVPISSVDFVSPADGAQPIEVQVIDGSLAGLPVTSWTAPISLTLVAPPEWGATLTGDPATPVDGRATFDGSAAPSIDVSATGYKLKATSTDAGVMISSGDSFPFTIVDLAEPCVPSDPCTGQSSKSAEPGAAGTEAKVVADGTDGTLVVTVASASGSTDVDVMEEVCNQFEGFVRHSHLVEFTVDQPTLSVIKTVEMTLFEATLNPKDYEVCWAGGDPWTQKDGSPAEVRSFLDLDGLPIDLYVGVLPDCKPRGRNATFEPCVETRTKDKRARTVTLIVSAPAGDPKVFF